MNKKILFIVNSGKISLNENGGASVYFSHLELLAKSGFKIELLAISWQKNVFKKEDYKEVLCYVNQVHHYKLISENQSKLKRLVNLVVSPQKFEYNFVNEQNNTFLQNLVVDLNIDMVWCEWRWSTIWATNTNIKLPIVYSHHDWEYKLAPLRKKLSLKEQFHNYQKKRVELSLVKKATACVSGSFTEAKEIENISLKPALYLPTTYKNLKNMLPSKKIPSLVHLGGMNTTANREGLLRFLKVCWPGLKEKISDLRLIVIGGLNGGSKELLNELKDPQIDCLGFVKDLSSVMISEDIHIIPWEYNTGTRTRVPVVFNYKQVLVATSNSVKAFPEVMHNKNALLSSNLEELNNLILKLVNNKNLRERLSSNAKQTFLDTFTTDSQVEKMKLFLHNII